MAKFSKGALLLINLSSGMGVGVVYESGMRYFDSLILSVLSLISFGVMANAL